MIAAEPFDFPAESWRAIETELRDLPHFAKVPAAWPTGRLVRAADDYLLRLAAGHVPLAERKKRWAITGKKLGEFKAALAAAIDAEVGSEAVGRDVENALEGGEAAIEQIESFVADFTSMVGRDDFLVQPIAPSCPARTALFRDVLEVWCWLGGELGVSRHPVTGEVGGPLARYFFAVVAPVMGNSVPAKSTFPGIVAAYRRRREEREAEHKKADVLGRSLN